MRKEMKKEKKKKKKGSALVHFTRLKLAGRTESTGAGAASERDLPDLHVLREELPRLSESRDTLDDTGREPSLLHSMTHQAQARKAADGGGSRRLTSTVRPAM